MSFFNTFNFILNHPLTRGSKIKTIMKWLTWQIGSRLVPGEVIINIVDDAYIIARPGLTGATGNIYVGLHEFEDMAFLLHYLRSDDLFIDVGANIGVYTILASKGCSAKCISIEPSVETYARLKRNVLLNDVSDLVTLLNKGVADKEGSLCFTIDQDTMNHIIINDVLPSNSCEISVTTLDKILGATIPQLVKIDVEGFEKPVIEGASFILDSTQPMAVIMEINNCSNRYGYDVDRLHSIMLSAGFVATTYDPFARKITELDSFNKIGNNTLYIRGPSYVCQRLVNAKAFNVKGMNI